MNGWEELLDLLASSPRENGTPALGETADALLLLLDRLGLQTELFSYIAYPLRLRLAGVVALLGGLAYAMALLRRRGAVALGLALLAPALLLLELEANVPVFGRIGATEQQHVEAIVAPEEFDQHLILAAHYDSKTDLLDHVVRAPIEILALPLTLVMLVAAAVCWRRSLRVGPDRPGRFQKATAIAAAAYGCFSFAALTGGAFLSERSPGALDDGAACAVLARLGERLAEAPPTRTRVSLLFLSGEEIGVQGSRAYAEQRFAAPPAVPTAMINLEFLGASREFAVFRGETFTTRSYPPAPHLVATIDAVHREQLEKPLWTTWYPAATDARSFLARGVPAMTLLNALPGHALPRRMHSPDDTRARIVPGALDAALDLLEGTVRRLDAEGLRGS